ncbi:hypothetical protein [Pedobacter sp. CFBP9032]|uniref:hypothetical protein n=1 Tax=Pedobacter sp. CFBP9032 TaxID=3096539 RepID=UPI002A6B3FB1|nr:hypothetical protein [Pedobacter sp. CFBP9032]MDY0906601.1 hypothetical protein [Pedobacter sp. CFBP9032]
MNNTIQLNTGKTAGEIFSSAKKLFGSSFYYEAVNDNYMIFKNALDNPIFTLYVENGSVTVVDVHPLVREDGEAIAFQNQIKKLV